MTAPLAWAPECGWTLAKPQPNSRLARSIASALGDVDILAAAIVAPARIALGILVGQHRALRLEHGPADDVLAGDQLDLVAARGRARPRPRRRVSGSASASGAEKKPGQRCSVVSWPAWARIAESAIRSTPTW